MAITANEIGKDLIEALGLPKLTKSFTLHARTGEFVRVQCEYYPQDGKAITTALMVYDLVPRFRPAPAPRAIHFDAWMGQRTAAAHAEFMERTSRQLRCDWSPLARAIDAYLNRTSA
ncbi:MULTISPECIES: hypothetical protein [unclassified Massilia]|uniref:hypothetical protein n=1 Tax=unclassified Massilia TaxID=2609279 RepID=UPI0017825B77|nr:MULTISPECIES: hypothetical protein [unclassified Massilia]MBD8531556.1 hypothetical protein [Massilia sp. CFBP 13647]MBD8673648.1 hypothetical protein [Massilia sp. CFBP 13721]